MTYQDVSPIIEQRCVGCHDGTPTGPWPLTSYAFVAGWADAVHDELIACTMPPSDAGVPMTHDERNALLTWILCGFPQ